MEYKIDVTKLNSKAALATATFQKGILAVLIDMHTKGMSEEEKSIYIKKIDDIQAEFYDASLKNSEFNG